MTDTTLRKRIWGWMAFDWATQPLYTLGVTFVFGPYFASVAQSYYLDTGLDTETAKASAQAVWSQGQMIAGIAIALLGPLIGAYADSTGRRLPWMIGFSALYAVSAWMMWFLYPDGTNLWFGLGMFLLCFFAGELALIFTNALLPSLGSPDDVGKLSGRGSALGYWGGVVALFIMLLFFFEKDGQTTILGLPPAFGLDPDAREGTRIVGPFMAIWFVVFMIPYFLWVREVRPAQKTGGVGQALSDLKTSLVGVTRRRSLGAFLVGSMLYRDALGALYAFGGVYAVLVLEWSLIQIAIFGVIAAISAAVFAYVGGSCDKRFGPRPVIIWCIYILCVVSLVIIGMTREFVFFIPLPPGSSAPDLIFYICGSAIGGAGGALYSASRSMMVRHATPDRPTETFGLFSLAGKATAFLAPALIHWATVVTNSPRLGLSPVIVLFVAGLILLRWVDKNGDRAEWASNAPVPSSA